MIFGKNKITLKIFSSSLLRSFLAEKVHFFTIEQSTVFIWQRRNATSKPDIRNHPNVYTRHVWPWTPFHPSFSPVSLPRQPCLRPSQHVWLGSHIYIDPTSLSSLRSPSEPAEQNPSANSCGGRRWRRDSNDSDDDETSQAAATAKQQGRCLQWWLECLKNALKKQ